MKRKALLESAPCHIPQMDSRCVIAASQIVQIGTEEYLNIDLFYGGRRRARYFADIDKSDWCVNIDGIWRQMTIRNTARVILGKEVAKGAEYYYYTDSWKFASKKDEKIAEDYLRTYAVGSFENDVTWLKKQRAVNRKGDKIAKMMSIVEPVPERAEQWLDEEIFPEHYLFVSDEEATRKYTCTKCGGKSWTKKKYKNYQMTICPKCGAEVKVEKKNNTKFKYANVIILQAIPKAGVWVERQFRAEAWWSPNGKRIDLHENIRAMISRGENYGKVYYGTEKNADEWQQDWWDKNTREQHFVNSYLYPYNLDEVLPYGNMEHSGMDVLAKQNLKFHVNKMIVQHGSRPYLEYLIKMGMTTLAVEIINQYGWWGDPSALNPRGRRLSELLRLDGNRANRMKELNGGLDMLSWLQYEAAAGVKISGESLEFLGKKKVSPDDCKEILTELRSVNRMVNYMKKQKIAPGKLVQTWRDYLRMAQEEGYDTTDDIVRLPKDLKARHDELVEIRNARRDEAERKRNAAKYKALDKQIMEHMTEVKKYFYEDDMYMIIPAGTCEELMEEGRTLHHCVGASDTYMKRMAEGVSWILFLRKKEELEKPYYTIEIDMKTDAIKQWYSEYDRKPDEKAISKLLNQFKNNIGKSIKKRAIA